MAVNKERHLTMSAGINAFGGLGPLFMYNLQKRQYRVFSSGDILVSVCHDNEMFSCATIMYKLSESPIGSPSGMVIQQLPPRLSVAAHDSLLTWDQVDLENLARMVGAPHS